MKRPSISDLVYNRTFPTPKQNEPASFLAHVQRNLVPEVRLEVQTFYGALDSIEAQYPGLDYTHAPHRRRLGRYPWHKRLFRVFDALGLTKHEILSICQWEGTKSAKDKYEAETDRKIDDTTMDGVTQVARRGPIATIHFNPMRRLSTATIAQVGTMDVKEMDMEQSDEDEIDSSVGVQLNEQLRSRDVPVDTDGGPLEEWLKYMTEHPDRDTLMECIRDGHPFPPPAVIERIRTNASTAVTRSDAIASSSRGPVATMSSVTSQPQTYGPTNEELLAAL